MPPPACGGQPKRKASIYAAIFVMSELQELKVLDQYLFFQNFKELTDIVMLGTFYKILGIVDTLSA